MTLYSKMSLGGFWGMLEGSTVRIINPDMKNGVDGYTLIRNVNEIKRGDVIHNYDGHEAVVKSVIEMKFIGQMINVYEYKDVPLHENTPVFYKNKWVRVKYIPEAYPTKIKVNSIYNFVLQDCGTISINDTVDVSILGNCGINDMYYGHQRVLEDIFEGRMYNKVYILGSDEYYEMIENEIYRHQYVYGHVILKPDAFIVDEDERVSINHHAIKRVA